LLNRGGKLQSLALARDANSNRERSKTVPQFDPQLVQVMRGVLEEVMTRVPLEIANSTTKAYLAEFILKTAAQGHTTYKDLLAAATDQIQVIASTFT
jgi:hypothetical protein